MKINTNFSTEPSTPQIHKVPFLQENKKIIIQFIFTVLFIGLGIWFLRHQKAEIFEVRETIGSSYKSWILIGLVGTIFFILLQGLMYYASFAALGFRINLISAVILYLKRNFISIFLPAGGISSLAFFTSDLENKGIPKSQIHFASSIYGFISILSVILVSIPAFIFALHEGSIGKTDWIGLIALILIFLSCYLVYRSIAKKGLVFRWVSKMFPSLEVFIEDLQLNKINKKNFLLTLLFSILVEVIGIIHIYISIKALGLTPTVLASVMAYLIAVIFLLVSPFLRGLGAIEVSTSFLLTGFGYNEVQAISITMLFRFFEFWIPMLLGILSFIFKLNKVMMRILPSILIFGLGVVNIISVLKPSTSIRVANIEQFLGLDLVSASNYFVLIIGIFLFITSAFLLKGLRSAWWMAVSFAFLSFLCHLIKGIDYTEAIVALVIFLILFVARKVYTIKHNWKLRSVGIQTAFFSIASVLVYGILGFYFLDQVHFNRHFNFSEILKFTSLNLILVGSPELIPADSFARHFIYSINIAGIFSISLLIFAFFRPYAVKREGALEELTSARDLVFQYGTSSLDYFKTYADKLFYFNASGSGFLAYRVYGNYSVVLEDPVSKDEEIAIETISGFERYCQDFGLKSIYYGTLEKNCEKYISLNKKKVLIGMDAEIDLLLFQDILINNDDYFVKIYTPPINSDLLNDIKAISDHWLEKTSSVEKVFTNGMFVKEELESHRIVTLENVDNKILAFMNLIPDYVTGEVSYDLFRYSQDTNSDKLELMLNKLFNELKTQGYNKFKLGFIPPVENLVLGVDTNSSINFSLNKIKSFIPYSQNITLFQRFNLLLRNRYLIYDDEYDLLQIPSVLQKITIP